jgi:hypothetical protein
MTGLCIICEWASVWRVGHTLRCRSAGGISGWETNGRSTNRCSKKGSHRRAAANAAQGRAVASQVSTVHVNGNDVWCLPHHADTDPDRPCTGRALKHGDAGWIRRRRRCRPRPSAGQAPFAGACPGVTDRMGCRTEGVLLRRRHTPRMSHKTAPYAERVGLEVAPLAACALVEDERRAKSPSTVPRDVGPPSRVSDRLGVFTRKGDRAREPAGDVR